MNRDTGRLWGLSWAHFLNDGAANYLPGILPALLIRLDLSVALAGTIMAALLVGQALQPFFGLLADRIGGRALVVAGLVGSSTGGALIGWVDDTAPLIAALMLIGISNALFHPQALAGVRQLAWPRQGSSMSFFLVGGEIGRGLWPALASLIVMFAGLQYLWILALPALFTLPMLWRWMPALPARRAAHTSLNWRRHAVPLSLIVTFCALRSLIIFSVITFVPVYWVAAGGSLAVGASFITVLMIVGVAGNLAGGRIGDQTGTRVVLVAAMCAAALLLGVFNLLPSAWLWLVLSLLGIAVFSTLPLTILIAQDVVPENRSFGSGLALGLANGLGALAVMALGPVAQTWGAGAPLWVAAGCALVAAGLGLVLPQHRPG